MRYEFRFSTDPEEDPEILKMVIEADTRSELLYNVFNQIWHTENLGFFDDDVTEILEQIFDRAMNSDKSTYGYDFYDFLTRCEFKLDLRRFLGENSDKSMDRVLHLLGDSICQHLYIESGGYEYHYEFLKG